MRVFVATYYNEDQARLAADEFISTIKEDECIEQLEIVPIGQRYRVGVMLAKKQLELDFGCIDSL